MRKKINIETLGRVGRMVMAVSLCAAFAFPVSAAAPSVHATPAYAASGAQHAPAKSKEKVKLVGKVGTMHTHRRWRVPTSKHLARYATFETKARYHYVCKTCGKELKKTYAWGKTLTGSLAERIRRNASKPTGGIAFTGSSLFSRWSNVAADINDAYGYPVNKIYNMALGGTGSARWARDDYVDAVAALKPSVVVVSGVNSVRYDGVVDQRSDEQAAQEGVDGVLSYIDKLKAKLPGVQVLVVGGIKTPNDYLREFDESTRIISWDRIDLYNSKLAEQLKGRSGVTFVDIQRYFMADLASGTFATESTETSDNPETNADDLGFYCDKKKLMNASSLTPTEEIVWARQEYGDLLDPYFRRDLRHPTALSYAKVWTPHVGKLAVQMARSAAEYSLGEQVR